MKRIIKMLGLLCVAPAFFSFINDHDIPSQQGGLAILGLILLFISTLLKRPEPTDQSQQNLINYQRNKIRIRDKKRSLPITKHLWNEYGVMRRKLRGGGRRELGNLLVFGAPGRGKSSLLKWWLTNSDKLNFIVVDLKGELWESTAGHRAEQGKVFRLDLTSTNGDSLDALNTDNQTRALLAIETFLPTDTGTNGDYFNEQAVQLALCYWKAARMTKQSALPVLVQAATLPISAMIMFAEDLAKLLPEEQRENLLLEFENAFGMLWNEPDSSNSERNSVVQSFKGAFNKLNTPEIMSTISHSTIDIKELVETRATLYISAPTTSPPYAIPIQLLIGGLVLEINEYVDKQRKGKQGEDIILLGDEAGNFKIPMFNELLSTGRSRGLCVTAFMQTMGQLQRYHKNGWRGLVDTSHHWVWFNSNDPDVHGFLRERCGKDAKGKPHFDQVGPKWKETEVLALLDFDRIYAVYGPVINPYSNRTTKQRMALEPPQLQQAQTTSRIRVFSEEEAERKAKAKEQQQQQKPLTIIKLDPEDKAKEIREEAKFKKQQQQQNHENNDDTDELARLDEVEKF